MTNLNGIPTMEQSLEIMKEAERTNPGAWIKHSKYVARAARSIASKLKNVNPENAFVLGLLHDIGRKDGDMNMKHIIVGYNYLLSLGYAKGAKICLTHTFPSKEIDSIYGKWDCSKSEISFVKQYINNTEYDIYDKLIQLCDSFSMSSGYLLIEKKMVNSIIRHGMNEKNINRLKASLKLKNFFDKQIGESVYNLLPRVVQNTFGFNMKI